MRFHGYRPRVWAAGVFVAIASMTAGILSPQASATDRLGPALQILPEDDGADCAVPNPTTVNNSKLPDPFLKMNGQRITAKSDWRCRRAEIKKQAETYVYGTKHGKPASVTGSVSSTNITVNVSDQGRSASFSAVVVLGGFGADTSTIRSAGAAVINYDPLAVGKEGTPRNNKQGAYYSIYGATSSTGLLAAWSWGVSRIIDVIEASGGNILKADAVGVTGCSRYGKGAFAIGAFDQRIALTMPIESGTAGVPIYRGIPGESGSQPLSSAYGEQPWFGDAFSSFTGNPNALPIDTHEIIGMIAPRGLFIMENPSIDWLGARSGSVAALGGAEIYKALGQGSNISYISNVQNGTHCAVRPEWTTPLRQSIQAFLLKSGSAPGVFNIAGAKAGNLSQWRDWTTPTLS
jgi:glucuronyl esterase-like protein